MRCVYCSRTMMKSPWDKELTTTVIGVKRFIGNTAICGQCSANEPVVAFDSNGFPIYAGDLGVIYP